MNDNCDGFAIVDRHRSADLDDVGGRGMTLALAVDSDGADSKPILPVVNDQDLPFICIAGSDEDDSLCMEKGLKHTKTILLPGGHHFGGNYEELADKILNALT